ncbi:MAG TPA: hypothetical protein VEQ41_07115, partial [Solirubrobacterales bacterium]|nr:hypothetical protein [Solirubrobacterales bacterium]
MDSDGIVYAEDGSGILRFDSVSGDTLPFYDLSLAIGSGANVVSLEIDPQTDDLLVLVTEAGVGPEGSRIVELDTSGNPAGASPSQLLSTHLPDAPVALNGLAIDPASDVFLLSWGFSNRILVLDDDGAQPPPAAALDEPAGVGVHQATLSGTVNPNGSDFPTRYRFEYARTDGEWQAASDFVDIGNGVVPQAVGPETITDLEANAAYKARLFAKRAFGAGTDISAERTFSTPKAPPEAATGAAQQVSATSAYLLGTINPNNLPSKYRFEYGTTAAYGSSVPVPDGVLNGGRPQAVGEAIGGLQPATTYHYRLVAESSEGAAVPQGQNRTFTTRPAVEPPPGRAYEMVTPPDKVNRRGGHNEPSEDNQAYPGIAAPDGESLMFAIFAAILDPEGGTSFPHALDFSVIRRSPQGWRGEAFTNLASIPPASAAPLGDPMGFSKDFDVSAWYHAKFIFPSSSPVGVKVFSDVGSGGYLNSGWYDWIGDPTIAAATGPAPNDPALVDDEGERVLKWSRLYRGLLGPSDPSHKQLAEDPDTSEPEGGGAIYMQEPPGSGAKHLVNECTSTGGFTQLPRRSGTASATDVIAVQNCQPGSPTSVRGAVIGSTDLVFRAMSDDGKRVFFTSPDPASGPAACTTALNAATDCPAQLFVRQYGSGAPGSTGPATVRWISRPRVSGTQRINLLRPALYQGASADGRYVFFKSEAPLTDDDPNGGNSITSGPASPNSWDLYRYEMPAGNDGVHGTADDVDADPGTGTLTRVTRGETGTAEPNLSDDGALDTRYISEDGERVYFVTPAPFAAADADNAPPAGSSGTNVPAGSAAATETRNLYLYDEGESGAARWKFVAHLGTTGVDGCATRALVTGPASKAETRSSAFSCIRATPDGGALVFESARRLTEDDVDTAADVYLYDAGADELVRISAPPVGVEPYLCEKTTGQTCNADLGMMIEMPVKGFGLSGFANYNLAIDAAGELSIFFESRSSLVPEDTNGSFWDTYRWRAGELSLISPGNSPDHAWYSGNSED